MDTYSAVVIGTSTGGLRALETILSELPKDFSLPIAVVQHISFDSPSSFIESLSEKIDIPVKEAEDKEVLSSGCVYFAPPNYHLLMESDGTISLSVDEKENYSRPSIDVLFESAADAYGTSLIGIILTGFNSDGAAGLKKIKQNGGLTLVQDPKSAEARTMPESAITTVQPDFVLPLDQIGSFLNSLGKAENDVH